MPNWLEVLGEIYDGLAKKSPIDEVRHKYLGEMSAHTGRNIISYYSACLTKPGIEQSSINDEDKNGFMMAIHKMDRTRGLDLILHTEGGSIAATQSIVDYLRQMFGANIRAVIPQYAMSAGTLMALSCKEIVLGKHSNLGPIDPSFGGIPAAGVIEEFDQAVEDIKQRPESVHLWQSIIGKYHPTFLSQCKHAIDWSNQFAKEQLQTVMFAGDTYAEAKATAVVDALSDYKINKRHERHIHFDECKSLNLNVTRLEDDNDLQDLVLTVHHCYMHAFANTDRFKIIENHEGVAYEKNHAPSR